MRAAWLIALLFPLMLAGQDLAMERKLYPMAHTDRQASAELLQLTAATDTSGPTQKAYRGAALMEAAQFADRIGSKLKLFKEGRELLAEAIEADPKSVEIHFLRMTVQENAPHILNYHDELKEDKAFILAHFPPLKDKGLRKMIQDHARSSAIYSEEEKARLMPDR